MGSRLVVAQKTVVEQHAGGRIRVWLVSPPPDEDVGVYSSAVVLHLQDKAFWLGLGERRVDQVLVCEWTVRDLVVTKRDLPSLLKRGTQG